MDLEKTNQQEQKRINTADAQEKGRTGKGIDNQLDIVRSTDKQTKKTKTDPPTFVEGCVVFGDTFDRRYHLLEASVCGRVPVTSSGSAHTPSDNHYSTVP